MAKYILKNNGYSLCAPVKAQEVGEELEKIPLENRTPREVLARARSKSSVLHKYFEWSDIVAAERFRLEQARALITCVAVEVNNSVVGGFVAVRLTESDHNQVFASEKEVAADGFLAEQVLEKALKELNFFKLKYQNWSEVLGPIFGEIKKLEDKMEGVKNGKKGESRSSGRRRNAGIGNSANKKQKNRSDHRGAVASHGK